MNVWATVEYTVSHCTDCERCLHNATLKLWDRGTQIEYNSQCREDIAQIAETSKPTSTTAQYQLVYTVIRRYKTPLAHTSPRTHKCAVPNRTGLKEASISPQGTTVKLLRNMRLIYSMLHNASSCDYRHQTQEATVFDHAIC